MNNNKYLNAFYPGFKHISLNTPLRYQNDKQMFRTSLAPNCMVNFGVLTTLTVALTFSSCKKDEDPIIPPTPPPSTAYQFPITNGSYWIYQQEQTDSDGVVTQSGAIDSTYVEGDTTIGVNTYKKIRTVTGPGNQYFFFQALILVRDSAGYIVGTSGDFIEHTNFQDTLKYNDYSGLLDAWYFMRHEDSSVTVPAGTFLTIDYEGHMYATDPNYPWPVPRYTHVIFADGIGKITEVLYYLSQPGYVQKRLIRYQIN